MRLQSGDRGDVGCSGAEQVQAESGRFGGRMADGRTWHHDQVQGRRAPAQRFARGAEKSVSGRSAWRGAGGGADEEQAVRYAVGSQYSG